MLRKPRWLIIALNVRHNFAAKRRLRRNVFESDIGATHARLSSAESVTYINRVFADYLRFARLTPEAIRGKRVLELGPGDNLGVALRFYAAGATHVIAVDKFYSRRDDEKQALIYRELRSSLSAGERKRYDEAMDLASNRINPKCVRYVFGCPAEQVGDVLESSSVDLIVSRAVLWEVFEISAALRSLDSVLAPGGQMVHKVACIDWMFRQEGYHPLEFMTVPYSVYRWMAADSGKSNRRTIAFYRNEFAGLGYDATFHITRIVGGDTEFGPGVVQLVPGVHYTDATPKLIEEIRPRLLAEFQAMSDHDLMIEDMFIVAEKMSSQKHQSGGEEAAV